jgi:hypothetical protein
VLTLFPNTVARVLFISLSLLLTEGCAARSAGISSGTVVQNHSGSSDAGVNRAGIAGPRSKGVGVTTVSLTGAELDEVVAAGPLAIASVQPNVDANVKLLVDRWIDALFELDVHRWVGIGVVVLMIVFYYLEGRSSLFSLAFAGACCGGAAYAIESGQMAMGIAAGLWGLLAVRKFWRQTKAKREGLSRAEQLTLAWFVRVIGIFAVGSGALLLVVDSPVSLKLPMAVSHSIIEAIPLLLVGVAYLAWLATEKPRMIDLVKQILIAVAFILWGVDLLMPTGAWARFVGAVVIAIYVFDLAWLMEGNLRRKLVAALDGPRDGGASGNEGERQWSGDTIGVHEGNGGRSQRAVGRAAI